MRVPLNCMTCMQVNGEPSPVWTHVDVRNGEAYVHTCPQGHVHYTVLQQVQHELLFEAAFHAAVDGYCREAVGTFAAALERFQEFAGRVCCAKLCMLGSAYDSAWKEVKNASERQYGAFVFVYGAAVGKMPVTLSNSQREFRNAVVHKGTFCSEADALQFGEQVKAIIEGCIQDMERECSIELEAAVFHAMHNASSTVPKGVGHSTMFIPTILTLVENGREKNTLAQLAADVRNGTRPRWLK